MNTEEIIKTIKAEALVLGRIDERLSGELLDVLKSLQTSEEVVKFWATLNTDRKNFYTVVTDWYRGCEEARKIILAALQAWLRSSPDNTLAGLMPPDDGIKFRVEDPKGCNHETT